MSGYAVYVYSAWVIVYLVIGVFVYRDRSKIKNLQEKHRDQ